MSGGPIVKDGSRSKTIRGVTSLEVTYPKCKRCGGSGQVATTECPDGVHDMPTQKSRR